MCAASPVVDRERGHLATEGVDMKVRASLSEAEMAAYVTRQINSIFPDGHHLTVDDVRSVLPEALARLEHCFSYVQNKYFFDGETAIFNHLHGDQYAMWLYILSNELYRQGADASLCSKLFLLNKSLHACDIFYEVSLPSVFLLVHPLGTVLGRANYSDFFVAYQRCGVGSNHDIFPTFGEYVTLRPGSSVLGNSTVGKNCQIAAEALVIDRDIDDDTIVMGRPGRVRKKPNYARYPLWRSDC